MDARYSDLNVKINIKKDNQWYCSIIHYILYESWKLNAKDTTEKENDWNKCLLLQTHITMNNSLVVAH